MAEPLSDAAGQGHNGGPLGEATQGLMYDFLERHEDIIAARKSLNKQKKALVGDIENAGIPIESWQHFLSTREQAGIIRERIDAGWRQLMAWDAKPVGLQTDIDLTAGQDGSLNDDELGRVERVGFEAGKNGRERESNPYTPSTEAYQRWNDSWLRGQAALAETLDGGAANGATRRRGRPKGTMEAATADRRAAEAEGEKAPASEQVH